MNLCIVHDIHEALFEFVQLVDLGASALRGIVAEADICFRREVYAKLDEVECSTGELRSLLERFASVAETAPH